MQAVVAKKNPAPRDKKERISLHFEDENRSMNFSERVEGGEMGWVVVFSEAVCTCIGVATFDLFARDPVALLSSSNRAK